MTQLGGPGRFRRASYFGVPQAVSGVSRRKGDERRIHNRVPQERIDGLHRGPRRKADLHRAQEIPWGHSSVYGNERGKYEYYWQHKAVDSRLEQNGAHPGFIMAAPEDAQEAQAAKERTSKRSKPSLHQISRDMALPR